MPKTRSASKARKSERLNKLALLKPRDGRKPKSTQNGISSPFRRSRKDKASQASSSSTSRRSSESSSSMCLKTTSKEKEKSIKVLVPKTDEVKREEQESKLDCKTLERMDARTYRAILKMSRRKLESSVDTSPVKGSKTCGVGLDEFPHKKRHPNGNGETQDGPLGRSKVKGNDENVKGSEPDSENTASEPFKRGDGLEFPCSTKRDNIDVVDKGFEPELQSTASEPLEIEDGLEFSISSEKENLDVDDKGLDTDLQNTASEPLKSANSLECSCSSENSNLDVDDKGLEPVLQNTASETLKSTDGIEFCCSAKKDNLDVDDKGLGPVLLKTASESLKSTDGLEISCSAEKDNLDVDDKGSEPVLQNSVSETLDSTDGVEFSCSAEKDNLNVDDKGSEPVLQDFVSESFKSADGLEFSCVAEKDDLDVGDKALEPDLENSKSKSLTNEDRSESSFSTLKDDYSKSMEVIVDRSPSDFGKSKNKTIQIDDGAGVSCSTQKDNFMVGSRSKDGNCLQVLDAETFSFPSTGCDEADNNPSNRESMQIDSSISNRNHKDMQMFTEQNFALESGPGQTGFKRKRDDTADLISVNEVTPESLNKLSLFTSSGNAEVGAEAGVGMKDTTSIVKDSLSEHSLSGSKPESSSFVEYWVPVQVSNVQLELYCSFLLSNLRALNSTLKLKNGLMHEVLISILKCCNHPYVVEPSLQPALTQGLTLDEICNIGGKASGKLQLLDAILSELKDQGLKCLILYQGLILVQPIGGPGRDNIGDILEDYIRYKFGTDSYEHVDGIGSRNSVLLAACNKFNTVTGRFILLLKKRACHRILKLSSVDAVIIYNSDLSPLNDLTAVQRITMDSNPKQIKVFRLYSYHTVEENILANTKMQINFGNSLQSITASNSHILLMPGAPYLFSKLDEFHHDSPNVTAGIVSKDSFNEGVLQELFSLIKDCRADVSVKYISKAEQDGENYLKNIYLFDAMEFKPATEELPHVFWKKLLNARYPIWKYLSTPLQRNRKRVHYFESELGDQASKKDDNPRKCKKVQGNNVDTSIVKDGPDAAKKSSAEKEKGDGLPGIPQVAEPEERRKLLHEQKCLLQFLKPKISELCEVMQLQESAIQLAENFLEYVIHNRRLSKESETILQAFQISVCWTAASLLDKKINRKESLVLARELLKLSCNEDEAELIYSKLQFLKDMFLGHSEELRSLHKKDTSIPLNIDASAEEAASNSEYASLEIFQSTYPECSSKALCTPSETVELAQRDILKNVKRWQKKFIQQLQWTKEKHVRELEKFRQLWEEEKGTLERRHRLESILTQSIHKNGPTSIKTDKLKHLAANYAQKLQELELSMTARLKDLQAKHQVKVAHLLEEVRSWSHVQRLNRLLSPASEEMAEKLHAAEQIKTVEGSMDTDSASKDDESRPDEASSGGHGYLVEPKSSEFSQNGNFLSSEPTIFTASRLVTDHGSTVVDYLTETRMAHEGLCNSHPQAVPSLNGSLKMPATQESPAMGMDETMAGGDAPVETSRLACGEPIVTLTSTASSSLLQPEGHGARSCQLAEVPEARAEAVSELHDVFLEEEASMSFDTGRTRDEAIGVLPTRAAKSTRISHFPHITPCYGDLLGELNTSQQSIFIPTPGLQNLAVDSSFATSNSTSESRVPPTVTHPSRTEILLPAARPAHSELCCFPMQVSTPEVDALSSSMTSDSLQNELERIQKQQELTTGAHFEMMKQLESDRDREIAQVLQRYNTRCAEAEAAFLHKKKELELNENKVRMNKFLAFTLRAMHSDEFGAVSQVQEAGPSSDAQLLHQVPHPAFNIQNSAPAGRVAHRSSATFPSHPSRTSQARPPHISSVTPVVGSQHQFRTEVRAPAPHLQHLRAAMPPPFSGVSAPVPGVASQHTTSSGVLHSTSHLRLTR
ncbi:Helicase protein MOM1-like protein [Drosera capensis]